MNLFNLQILRAIELLSRETEWKMIKKLTGSAENRYNKGKLEMRFSKTGKSRTDTEVASLNSLIKTVDFLKNEVKAAEFRCVFPNAMF